jgi:gamma-glutamylaminecyclotransferase
MTDGTPAPMLAAKPAPTPALATLFVYGTLKEGFGNHHINAGTRVPGDYVTVQPHGLYIVGPHRYPWLVQGDLRGQPVRGQLFRVDAAALARMDVLEQVDEPGWYTRHIIEVRDVTSVASAASPPVLAYVYFGDAQALQSQAVHAGPLAEFSIEMQTRFGTQVG